MASSSLQLCGKIYIYELRKKITFYNENYPKEYQHYLEALGGGFGCCLSNSIDENLPKIRSSSSFCLLEKQLIPNTSNLLTCMWK